MSKEKKKLLAFGAFIESVLLGLIFVYLFTWKAPGVSHLIYFTLVLSGSFVPLLIINPQKLLKERTLFLMAFPLVAALMSVFLYRLDEAWVFLAYLSLPLVCTVYLASLHADGTLSNFGIFSYLILLFKLFIAWFVDSIKFIRNLSIKDFLGKNSQLSSWTKRIILGLVISVPFAAFFLLMFSLADSFFAESLNNLMDSTFGQWFKDFESFVSFVGRFIIGVLVAIYFSVFNFSLWNEESKLKEWMRKNIKKAGDVKRNLDVIVASTLLFVLNIIFGAFVIFQFVYFFGGSENVIGDNASFTYAQYARKGFWELLFVSIVAYMVILILNLKVKTKGIVQKLVFYGNYVFIVLSVLIINYSSHSRLSLYEDVYGFTGLRLFVHMTIVAIALQYIFVLVSPLIKKAHRFISFTSAILLFVFYCVLMLLPMDYVVARQNLKRFRDGGDIDVAYLLKLSDEAIPVMVDVADEVPDSMRYVILAELDERYEDMKDKREGWMSYNIWFERNKNLLEDVLEDEYNWLENARIELNEFVDEYGRYIENEKFEQVYTKFWLEEAVATDLMEDLEEYNVNVTKYEKNNEITSLNHFYGTTTVYIDIEYSFREGGTFIRKCNYGYIELRMTGDGWKVVEDTAFPLAYLTDDRGGNPYVRSGFFSEYGAPCSDDDYYWEEDY